MTAAIGKTACVALSNTFCTTIALLCVALGTFGCSQQAQAKTSQFVASSASNVSQATDLDEVLLVSTRSVGTVCNVDAMKSRLKCERYLEGSDGNRHWISADWQEALTTSNTCQQTFVYVHGNRVARGEDRTRGMKVYRSLRAQGQSHTPIRFIIWSWPSSAIPGPMKDYQVKASRTRPVSWQFAWFLNQLPAQTNVSILGYSYGARITSGAMHVLGGGSLSGLKLEAKSSQLLPTFRIALLAAAFNADWLQPGHYHGRAVSQVDRLVLITNRFDPAMRFFHLSNGRGRVHALGKAGISNPRSLGPLAQRIRPINMSYSVGRSHYLTDYLAATSKMRLIWSNLVLDSSTHSKESLAVSVSENRVE